MASGELEVFGARQTDALDACDGKRELLVWAIVTHNGYLKALSEARERDHCLATRGWRIWRDCDGG